MALLRRHSSYRQRSLAAVPGYLVGLLLLLLLLQVGTGLYRQPPEARVEALPAVPAMPYLQVLSFGDPAFLSRLLVLWLQTHDYQQGVSLSYREIDYTRLAGWLAASLKLDPGHDYPLLLASRVYAMVDDAERQRVMLDFVAEQFRERPVDRWRWLAHAVYVAKHRLKDEPLALEYARLLTRETQPGEIPDWARQMQIFILADMGEVEAAKVLLGGLLESGEMTDSGEYRYLLQRLEHQAQE